MANPSMLLLEPDLLLSQALLHQLPSGVAHSQAAPPAPPEVMLLRASVLKAAAHTVKADRLIVLMDESAPLPDHAVAVALPVRRDRLRAVLEGIAPDAATPLGGIGYWHPAQRRLTGQAAQVSLTEKETALFALLLESEDGADAGTLRRLLWPDQAQPSPHALPALLSRLRAQLDVCFGDALTIAHDGATYVLRYA